MSREPPFASFLRGENGLQGPSPINLCTHHVCNHFVSACNLTAPSFSTNVAGTWSDMAGAHPTNTGTASLEMVISQPSYNVWQFSPQMLFRPDARTYFDRNRTLIHGVWSQLTLDTSLGESMSIPHAMAALRVVDDVTTDNARPYWQHRLAYLLLHRNLQVLEQIVERKRQRGEISYPHNRRNTAIVLEIYSNALKGKSEKHARHQVRLAKRWSLSLRSSQFLAVAYSAYAETRMYVVDLELINNRSANVYSARTFL